jgi:hypothetical protein
MILVWVIQKINSNSGSVPSSSKRSIRWFSPLSVGSGHREETMHLCKIWTWGYKICSLIGQSGDDKCSQNENFHMDVIFHVWVDVTLSTLSFEVVECSRF